MSVRHDPNRPTCEPCNWPMSIYLPTVWKCAKCGARLPRIATAEELQHAADVKAAYEQTRVEARRTRGVKAGQQNAATFWKCVKASEQDFYRPGYRYNSTIVREDMRDGHIHKGTAFIRPDGTRVEV